MTKKELKLLAHNSYTKGFLDAKKVKRIAKLLRVIELRQYIKELKKFEQGKTVRIVVPNMEMVNQTMVNKVRAKYPNKRVIVDEDPELILGVKIIDNDLIYELNLKNSLENINRHMIEQYDN